MVPSLRNLFKHRDKGKAKAAVQPSPDPRSESGGESRSWPKAPPVDAMWEDLDEDQKRFVQVMDYIDAKITGTIHLRLDEPQPHTAYISARVSWFGEGNRIVFVSSWEDRGKGFVTASHASFEAYRRKRYVIIPDWHPLFSEDEEGYVLLDIESDPRYENVNPGTVTVEGFGLECWDYEECFGTPRPQELLINRYRTPDVPPCKLLRRLHELRKGPRPLGVNPVLDEADLREFIGDMPTSYPLSQGPHDPDMWIIDLFSLLNREVFDYLIRDPCVGTVWTGPRILVLGWWNFLWHMIIAKELSRRLERNLPPFRTQFSLQILAALIIADLWVQNVSITLEDEEINPKVLGKEATAENKARAEQLAVKADELEDNGLHLAAIKVYTQAIETDLRSAVYRCKRSSAFYSWGDYGQAAEDAYDATRLDPQYSDAWMQLGKAQVQLGHGQRALASFRRAADLVGPDPGAMAMLAQGLADATAAAQRELQAIDAETDIVKKSMLEKELSDKDWDMAQKRYIMRSLVDERQVEGLVLFAERIKWPYLNEVCERVKNLYTEIMTIGHAPLPLLEWILGISLPGRWFAWKIMAALILCTPPLAENPGVCFYYDAGLSLSESSYWRARTVLARVLGCLPGVVSLNGWIGPLPPVIFDPPLPTGSRHIRPTARRVVPMSFALKSDDGQEASENFESRFDETQPIPGDDAERYMTAMGDPNQWVIPQPPEAQINTTCTAKAIQLKKLPMDATSA